MLAQTPKCNDTYFETTLLLLPSLGTLDITLQQLIKGRAGNLGWGIWRPILGRLLATTLQPQKHCCEKNNVVT